MTLLLLLGITFAFAEMDYIECTTNCETMKDIWGCEYSYCTLYDKTAYNAMPSLYQIISALFCVKAAIGKK